jgi:hypothetical protein
MSLLLSFLPSRNACCAFLFLSLLLKPNIYFFIFVKFVDLKRKTFKKKNSKIFAEKITHVKVGSFVCGVMSP